MNIAKVFAEKPQIGWVALVGVLIWGGVSYVQLPQRKDPEIKIKTAVVSTVWPGASAADVEQLVTRPLEQLAGQVAHVDIITSTSYAGRSTVFVTLEDKVKPADVDPVWEDLRGRLDTLKGLPNTAHKPVLNSHFGRHGHRRLQPGQPARGPGGGVAPGRGDSPGAGAETGAGRAARGAPEHAHRLSRRRGRGPGGGRGRAVRRPGRAAGALADAAVLSGARFTAIDFTPLSEERLVALDADFRARWWAPSSRTPTSGARCASGTSTTLEARLARGRAGQVQLPRARRGRAPRCATSWPALPGVGRVRAARRGARARLAAASRRNGWPRWASARGRSPRRCAAATPPCPAACSTPASSCCWSTPARASTTPRRSSTPSSPARPTGKPSTCATWPRCAAPTTPPPTPAGWPGAGRRAAGGGRARWRWRCRRAPACR